MVNETTGMGEELTYNKLFYTTRFLTFDVIVLVFFFFFFFFFAFTSCVLCESIDYCVLVFVSLCVGVVGFFLGGRLWVCVCVCVCVSFIFMMASYFQH